jgi:hypothetical protein
MDVPVCDDFRSFVRSFTATVKPRNSSDAIEDRRKSASIPDDASKAGWLKIRGSLNVWWTRWCVVRPGKLCYYRNEGTEYCFGIVLLQGCTVSKRDSKKSGKRLIRTNISACHAPTTKELSSLTFIGRLIVIYYFLRLGFCFKISHPDSKSIYATRGLKGESLASMKVPGNLQECILRCKGKTTNGDERWRRAM